LNNFVEKFSDKLIDLVMKVAKEQGLCMLGSKVLIFYSDNEGTPQETVNFKLMEIDVEGE
jgi:hypothetical protein